MSDRRIPDDQLSFAEVEAAIGAAGRYVWPSDDLRPRTLEAAREDYQDRRARRTLGRSLIAAVLLLALGAPVLGQVDDKLKPYAAPSASEMQRRALEHAAQAGVGANWGLLEAFIELRRHQANHLRGK